MMNNIPYLRKNISTLLALSAIALLLLSSPLVLFNLVPVQAQTNLIFRTPTPASGMSPTGEEFSLTFDAQGTPSSIDPQTA
jgi:hypothetical protein